MKHSHQYTPQNNCEHCFQYWPFLYCAKDNSEQWIYEKHERGINFYDDVHYQLVNSRHSKPEAGKLKFFSKSVPCLLPYDPWHKTGISLFCDLMCLSCLNEINEGEGGINVQ